MIAADILTAPPVTETSVAVTSAQPASAEGADFAQVLAAEVGDPAAAAAVATATTAAATPPAEGGAPEIALDTAVATNIETSPSSAAIIATLTAAKPATLAAAPVPTGAVPVTQTETAPKAANATTPAVSGVTAPAVGGQTAQPATDQATTTDDATAIDPAIDPATDQPMPVAAEQADMVLADDGQPAVTAATVSEQTDPTKTDTADADETADPAKENADLAKAETGEATAQIAAPALPLPAATASADLTAPVNPALAGATGADGQTEAAPDAKPDGEDKAASTETVATGKGKHRLRGNFMGTLASGSMRAAKTASDMQARAAALSGDSKTDRTEASDPAAKIKTGDDAKIDAFRDHLTEQVTQPQDTAGQEAPTDLRGLTLQTTSQTTAASADKTGSQAIDATPVDVTQPGWEGKLGDRILSRLTENGQEIEMDLNPENLGSVRIKLELTDGTAQVRIVTDTAQAAQVFQQAESKLAEALNRAGVSLSSHDATSRDAAAGGQQRGAGNGGNGSGNGTGGRHDGALANMRRDQTDLSAFTAGRRAAGIVNIVA